MALTGSSVRDHKAKKIGVVDLVVDNSALERSAIAAVKDMAAKKNFFSRKKKLLDRFLGLPVIREYVLFGQGSFSSSAHHCRLSDIPLVSTSL